MKRVYIAGYIGNDPNAQDKFAFVARLLEVMGHQPINPMELDHAGNTSWSQHMITDLHAMLDCDAVLALPCWKKSKGATIEVQLAMRLGKEILYDVS